MDHEFVVDKFVTANNELDFVIRCRQCGVFMNFTETSIAPLNSVDCSEEERIMYRLKGKQ